MSLKQMISACPHFPLIRSICATFSLQTSYAIIPIFDLKFFKNNKNLNFSKKKSKGKIDHKPQKSNIATYIDYCLNCKTLFLLTNSVYDKQKL